MLPNFYSKDWVVVSHRVSQKNVERGEVVTAICPMDPKVFISKRVIGLGGDVICVDPWKESADRRYIKIPRGHVWLQGDNIENSTDSREYGPVPMGLIVGKVLYRLFPTFEPVLNGFALTDKLIHE
jgi:signal peptidase I